MLTIHPRIREYIEARRRDPGHRPRLLQLRDQAEELAVYRGGALHLEGPDGRLHPTMHAIDLWDAHEAAAGR